MICDYAYLIILYQFAADDLWLCLFIIINSGYLQDIGWWGLGQPELNGVAYNTIEGGRKPLPTAPKTTKTLEIKCEIRLNEIKHY